MFIQFLVLINKKLYIRDVFSLLYVVLMARNQQRHQGAATHRRWPAVFPRHKWPTSAPTGEFAGRPLVPGETLPAPPVMNWGANRHYNFWT